MLYLTSIGLLSEGATSYAMKFIICILSMMAWQATARPGEDVPQQTPQNILTAANNAFSTKMFNEVWKAESGKSFVMSGFSALSPLAQLGLGAVEDSHDEILSVIGMPDDEVIKSAFSSMNSNLRSVKGIELKVANRIYIAEGAELNETFAEMSHDVFGTDVKNINFADSGSAVSTINKWVEDNTNNRIQKLLSPDAVGAQTQAVLINAIYFLGKWSRQFNKDETEPRNFYVTKDETVKVPTMHRKDNFRYGDLFDKDAKALELFYEGGEASMLILLPKKIDGIDELQQKVLESSFLSSLPFYMYNTEVDVYLPKFKIETTIELTSVLQNIGIRKLFGGNAKLYNILKSSKDLSISAAIQKAFMEVDEEGTEAAAATAFLASATSVGASPRQAQFVVDRPFIFYLKYKDNVLFTGVGRF